MHFMPATLFRELEEIVGTSQVLNHPEELLAYECDGLTFHRSMPDLVVLPESTEQVSRLLKLARRYDMPFIARGSGTGLSGGATPVRGGMIIGTSRMKEIVDIDQDNSAAVVQPGVINLEVSRRVAPHGFFYAPDPSSQVACTLGGNVAENSGGPHCLKYGTTVNHILELTVVLANGDAMRLGSAAADPPGYDLCGVFVGSEGTFGIATEIRLRLVRISPATRTLLAAYQEVMPAIQTVTDIVAAGIVPVALEMMDRAIIQAVEDSSYRAGYPRDAGAVLLIELDGLQAALNVREDQIRELCRNNGCTEIRVARDEKERAALWAGRKGAFGACGRLSPNMYLTDTVVPRNRLPEVLASVYAIGQKHGIRMANVFHAGDGNLHPILLYDEKNEEETGRMLAACAEITEACVAVGGCLSGEHGIGLDKRDLMDRQFSEPDLEAMLKVKRAFDPEGLCNPEKVLPQRPGCGEAGRWNPQRLPEGVWV
jgi:glycolate oxidase subunit GlcD